MGKKNNITQNRIGWIPSSTDLNVASSRIRCLDPMSFLQSLNYPVELFNKTHAHRYKAVIFSKKYSSGDYRLARKLQENGTKVILDICDNHFYNPANNETLAKRAADLKKMVDLCNILSVSTPTLKEIVIQETHYPNKIYVIDDAPEKQILSSTGFLRRIFNKILFSVYKRKLAQHITTGRTPIVWFGTHGQPNIPSGMEDLLLIQSSLETIHKSNPIVLTVISNSKQKYDALISKMPFPTLYIEWNPDTFLSLLQLQKITVIPIQQNPFTICKSNNRLVLAIMNNLAVVASGIPSYQDFKNVCFLDRFNEGLRTYIQNPELRHKHILEGQKLIQKHWNIENIAMQWKNLFESVLRG